MHGHQVGASKGHVQQHSSFLLLRLARAPRRTGKATFSSGETNRQDPLDDLMSTELSNVNEYL